MRDSIMPMPFSFDFKSNIPAERDDNNDNAYYYYTGGGSNGSFNDFNACFTEEVQNKIKNELEPFDINADQIFESSAFTAFETGINELLKNSFDAGATEFEVKITLEEDAIYDYKISIEYKDNGSGFPENELAKYEDHKYHDLTKDHEYPSSEGSYKKQDKKIDKIQEINGRRIKTTGGSGIGLYLVAKIAQSNNNIIEDYGNLFIDNNNGAKITISSYTDKKSPFNFLYLTSIKDLGLATVSAVHDYMDGKNQGGNMDLVLPLLKLRNNNQNKNTDSPFSNASSNDSLGNDDSSPEQGRVVVSLTPPRRPKSSENPLKTTPNSKNSSNSNSPDRPALLDISLKDQENLRNKAAALKQVSRRLFCP